MPDTSNTPWINTTKTLGYLGLVPFLLCLLALFFFDDSKIIALITKAIIFYSAIIITFVSAVHWGIVLQAVDGTHLPKLLIISILPSLIAWGLLFVPEKYALAGFFFCFIVWQQYEAHIQQDLNFPDWYLLLRKHLSYAVAGLILLIWLVNLSR